MVKLKATEAEFIDDANSEEKSLLSITKQNL